MSNNGCLRIETYLAPTQGKDYLFSFDCTDGTLDRDGREKRLGIHLMKTGQRQDMSDAVFPRHSRPQFDRMLWSGAPNTVYIRKDLTPIESTKVRIQFMLQSSLIFHFHFHTPHRSRVHNMNLQAQPSSAWDRCERIEGTSSPATRKKLWRLCAVKSRWWRFVIVCGLIDPRAANPSRRQADHGLEAIEMLE
ncbi:hypothetical protein QBC32DRAFT_316765 [Pseudoneurospora amorphoporcata]|uniref:Uncharacterized protein n=1 Tax=Pseudoneurospora amorphoporcata TaxID=241081 RepID=A0AAN6NR38_9PEZI|nr:hypothetical protein QBC32DRAFT_316765 [Pseudoneurospora amorphoporcata]